MTTTTVQTVVAAAQHLSPRKQLEVIQALTELLQQGYVQTSARLPISSQRIDTLLGYIRRAPIATSLADFAGDFWPDDETADDVSHYLSQQRAADRAHDLPDLDKTI